MNYTPWQENVLYIDTDKKLQQVVSWVYDVQDIALDTETTGLRFYHDKLHLLQLGNTHIQYAMDMYKLKDSPFLPSLWEALSRPNLTLYAHNAKFDFGMIMGNYGIEPPNWVCTYVANELLSKGINSSSSSLAYCLDKYLGVKLDKREQSAFQDIEWGDPLTESQIEYAASDVQYLIPLWKKQKEQLDELNMQTLYEMEFEVIKACADLEYNGIYINTDKWIKLRNKAVKRRDDVLEKLDKEFLKVCPPDIFGKPIINYKSPQQVLPALSKLIEYKLESTSTDALAPFTDSEPSVEHLLEYRKATKLVDTYGLKFLRENVDPITKRIHSNFRQLGTETGRMASRRPNLQNIPKQQEYRDPFEVQDKENYRMISADFSG